MVHKRYVKRGDKIYGPYFYESFRDEEGKVKNNYLGLSPKKEKTNKKTALVLTVILLGILGIFSLFNALEITGLTTKETGNTNLTIYDDTESLNIDYYSNKSFYVPSIGYTASDVPFTANYTDTSTGDMIVGNCTIAFNTTGTNGFTDHFQMNFNESGFEGSYRYNYSFDRSGTFQFNITCNATGYEDLSIIDYFTVSNLDPYTPGYATSLPSQTCQEEAICYYNFSFNVTDYDVNDLPIVNFATENTFSCLTINRTTGMVTVNCTTDADSGYFVNTDLKAYDSANASVSRKQIWTITSVNDAPQFNDTTWTWTVEQNDFVSRVFSAWDEEDGSSYPNQTYWINATGSTSWNEWLNESNIDKTNGNISFLATNNNIGTWNVNVTVNDSTGLSTSHNLQITITDVNDPPNLTLACDTDLASTGTEDTLFECWLNATDVDAGETLTFTANYTFLHLNGSAVPTEGGQSGVLLNLTPTDTEVGTWWVNFTVTDSEGATDTERISLIITNVEEYPYFTDLDNMTTYANVRFYYDVNALDNDTNLPQTPDSIKYTDNSSLFEINIDTGAIEFIPINASSGTHWINITVNDTTDRSISRVINFTIIPNTAPNFTADGNFSITEGILFFHNFTLNFTDAEGDNFTFIDNTTLFDISTYGNLTINATELDIGVHWVTINATDYRGATSSNVMNFTIYNVNEAPWLFDITGINTTDGAEINFNVSANDSDLLNSNNNENLTFTFNYTWIQFTKANDTTARVAFTIPAHIGGTYYWVNCTVNDTSGAEDSYVFYMNITESVDYPKFTYLCDNERTQTEDTAFTCWINATDLDAGATLAFSTNYTWFSLNESAITVEGDNAGSLVNFTPDYTEVGNWSINVSVTDGIYINTTIISFNISSVNDQPNITTQDVITGYTLHQIRYDINATDEEDGADGTTTNLTFTVNNSDFTIDSSGILTFTPTIDQNGTHWVNVTVNDTQDYGFSYIYNVTVIRNSAPVCHVFLRGGVPTTPPDSFTINENQSTGQFSTICNDTEGDTVYYHWFWNGALNRTGSTTPDKSWNYTTSFTDSGERNISLIVSDNVDNTTYYWNVTVLNTNAAPQMYKDIPNITSGWFQNSDRSILLTEYFYDLDEDNLTYDWYYYGINESFDNITLWTPLQGTWNVTDNSTNSFYNQSSTNGETLTVYNTSFDNITSMEVKIRAYGNKEAGICFRAQENNCSNSYKAYFGSSKLVWEIQEDGSATASNSSIDLTIDDDFWYWLKITAKGDELVVYYSNNSANYTLAYNITNNTYRNGKILLFTSDTRADFDDITLKSQTLKEFTTTLDTNTSNLTFSPTPEWYGAQQARITCTDGNETIESNIFYLTIYHATPGVETVTTTRTLAGGTSLQTQTASLDIIVPAMITLNALTTTLVPVILNNSGEVPLNLIDLTAFTNVSGLKLTFNTNNWDTLGVGEQVSAMLEVEAGLLAPERYVIEIIGTSKSPRVRQTAKISVDVREREAALKVQLKENIAFTRDLFLQNPECLELTELLDRAQELYDQGLFEEGLELVKTANEGCKNFISQKGKRITAVAAKKFLEENWKILIAEASGLILLIMLMTYYLRRRKFRGKAEFT
ncbi:MAG: hypothetical protein ABIH53_02145 [archaeon]